MRLRLAQLAIASVLLAGCGQEPSAIRIEGSSTVYPFTRTVAEAFVAGQDGRTAPSVTSSGTSAGIGRFCSGNAAELPDIADASRRMTRIEFAKCRDNGVGDILEIAIGLDGIALAESNRGPKLALAVKDLYRALAATVDGQPNRASTWRDVNPALPAIPIKVVGPPSTSGTRELFADLMLAPGCMQALPTASDLKNAPDPAVFDAACRRIRGDGAYVEVGEDDTRIVEALEQDPNALGVLGYSYLEKNAGRLRGVAIDGFMPDSETIGSGEYPGVRSLYLYVKKDQLKRKPELQAFLDLYATMWQPGGPLVQQGLIAMSERSRSNSAKVIEGGTPLEAAALP